MFIPLTTRASTRDTYLDGYFIPKVCIFVLIPVLINYQNQFFGNENSKDTTAAINLFQVHHNPEVWDNPGTFCPERFIDDDGKLKNQELILPFGTGLWLIKKYSTH